MVLVITIWKGFSRHTLFIPTFLQHATGCSDLPKGSISIENETPKSVTPSGLTGQHSGPRRSTYWDVTVEVRMDIGLLDQAEYKDAFFSYPLPTGATPLTPRASCRFGNTFTSTATIHNTGWQEIQK